MRAIMIMYDSLRRDMLPCYGQTPLHMPNFERLADHTVIFDRSYACSLPCMPARRELHTGRPNFLHRSWGPVEPFDDSMPTLLKNAGIHTHLSTDHYHYIQDGGATYCGRYSSWNCFRGQESDAWQGDCTPHGVQLPPNVLVGEKTHPMMKKARYRGGWQNMANRAGLEEQRLFPQTQTFEDGLAFIQKNKDFDNWFLQIEAFDPHEPFTSPEGFQSSWIDPDEPFAPDWPSYGPVTENAETVEKMRRKYFALAEYCDWCLGQVLDKMDALDLWKDTALIVNTDHGFLLSEHSWWGKNVTPDFEELTHTPLFIWDPRCGRRGERSEALVQTIDLAPTLLELFGQPIPKDMTGKPLGKTLSEGEAVREYAMFGYHGGPVNITDGRYVYMRAVQNSQVPLNEYTLMPTHMNQMFAPAELQNAQLHSGFSFTKGCPVLQIASQSGALMGMKLKKDLLFDLETDPAQTAPITDEAVTVRMLTALTALFEENDAPDSMYTRFDLQKPQR